MPKVTAAMPRMATRTSGDTAHLQGLDERAGKAPREPAGDDVPGAGDEDRGCDRYERGNAPRHEIGLALPEPEQERKEGRGEREVEPVLHGVVDRGAEQPADERGEQPGEIAKARRAEIVGRRAAALGDLGHGQRPLLV